MSTSPNTPESRAGARIQSTSSRLLLSNQYDLEAPLGAGGMGIVYRARDVVLDRTVAIKFLPPEVAANEAAYLRFASEARLISKLRHSNVILLYSFGRADDGTAYFAMEYARGGCLKELLRERGRLPAGEAIALALGISAGVGAAHDAGLVHRDLKPANVLLDHTGSDSADERWVVKVADFGLAKAFGDASAAAQLTTPGTVVGSPAYMAPEQALGAAVGPATDVYALGVMLYEMLTGRLPYAAGTFVEWVAAIQSVTPARASSLLGAAACPPALDALIAEMLAKDPASRPSNAGEVTIALQNIGLVSSPGQWWHPRRSTPSRPAVEPAHLRTVAVAALALDSESLSSKAAEDVDAAESELRKALEAEADRTGASVLDVRAGQGGLVFGVPVAHERDAERAADAGARILQELSTRGISIRGAVELGQAVARIGPEAPLASGSAAAGIRVAGRCVNSAFTRALATPAGQLALGPEAVAACRRGVVRDSLGIATWGGERSSPGPTRTDNPLIGREHERELVLQWVRGALQGRGGAVLVTGAWGLGKTHLVAQVVDELAAQTSLRVEALECAEAVPDALHAFAVGLRRRAGMGDAAPASEAARRLQALWSTVGAPLDEEGAARLVRWLSPPEPPAPPGEEWGETAAMPAHLTASMSSPEALFEPLADWLLAGTSEQPTLVWLDDIQWADGATREFITYLAHEMEGTRAAVVLSGRECDATTDAWTHALGSKARSLTLDPLDAQKCAEIARRALVARGVDDERLVDAIGIESRGSPAWALMLAERGGPPGSAAPMSSPAWPAAPASESTLQPSEASVAAPAIASRVLGILDALPQPLRRLIDAASVIGPVFWPGAVGFVLEVPRPVAALERLRQAGLARKRRASRFPDEAEYTLTDPHMASVVSSHLRAHDRQRLRERAASWLEARAPHGDMALAGLIAQQWDALGRSDKALPAYAQAAEHARQNWDLRAALAALERWLALAPPGDAAWPQRVADAAALALEMGDSSRAVAWASSLVASAGPPRASASLLARAHELLGLAALGTGALDRASAAFEAALSAGPPDEQAALVQSRLSALAIRQGRLQEAIHQLQATATALDAGAARRNTPAWAARARAQVATVTGTALRRAGALEQAAHQYQLARTLLESIGDTAGMAVALNNLAVVAMARQDPEAAEQLARQAVDAYQRAGALVRRGATLGNLGEILIARGRLREALDVLEHAVRVNRSVRAGEALADALRNRACALRHLGRMAEARESALSAVAQAQQAASPFVEAQALQALWEWELTDGGSDGAAREQLRTALDGARARAGLPPLDAERRAGRATEPFEETTSHEH